MWGGFALSEHGDEAILAGKGPTLADALIALRDAMRSPFGIKFVATDTTQEAVVRYQDGGFRTLTLAEADTVRRSVRGEVARIRDH